MFFVCDIKIIFAMFTLFPQILFTISQMLPPQNVTKNLTERTKLSLLDKREHYLRSLNSVSEGRGKSLAI